MKPVRVVFWKRPLLTFSDTTKTIVPSSGKLETLHYDLTMGRQLNACLSAERKYSFDLIIKNNNNKCLYHVMSLHEVI